MSIERKHAMNRVVIYGVLSAALYALLYVLADPILELSQRGHWYFVIPIAIAFAVSFVHGNFTGYFWDLLGFKAKSVKK
ncbi:MAG: hypothetical protein ACFCUJ_11850 [Thiotrichales bacterium]